MSGTNSTFNRFIEMTKDDWYTGTELLLGYLIQNVTEKYNNMVAEKEWNKIDPKDAKTTALTTSLSNLDRKKLLSLQQFN